MKKLKAFTLIEISIAIALIITISYLSLPLLQKQKMIDDTKNLVNEISNIINNDIRDPFYGYIRENKNTLNSITTNGICKTTDDIPPCSGNLTYTCISSNRIASCTEKSYLNNSIVDSNFSPIQIPKTGYLPSSYITLKSFPGSVFLQFENNSSNLFKLKILVKGDFLSINEKNMVLIMIKSKLFSEVGVFNSLVDSISGETICDEQNDSCSIEYILR